jgi:SAM-dependent methyltransferase
MWDKGWDDIFKNNEWGRYPPEELVRFVSRNFGNSRDKSNIKILEIGSGTGANLWYMAREGFNVSGIDGSRVGVKRADKILKENGLKAKIVVSDAVSLPFDDGVFDCVIDNECIYANSYKDSLKIMEETYRVLRDNGKFYSRTFMTGTYGDGNGKKLKGEKNTYLEIHEGALRKGYGIIRFTQEKEIPKLYGKFKIESVDYIIKSAKNRQYEIKEWIIICSKPGK